MRNIVMRNVVVAMLVILGLAGAAAAADNSAVAADNSTREVEFLNGIYAVEVPANWWVKEDDSNQRVIIAQSQNSPFRLVISSPLPGIEDQAGYSELVVKAILAELGGDGKVLAEEMEQEGPETLIRTIFNSRHPQGNVDCMLDTVELHGYIITMLILGPDEGFNDFLPIAQDIKESYAIDPDKLDENHEALEEIAKATVGQLIRTIDPSQNVGGISAPEAVGAAR